MKAKRGKILIWIIFIIYLALLVKVILFKYPMSMVKEILKSTKTVPLSFRLGNSNFMPFKSIYGFLFESKNIRISIVNVLGNILAFMPFGFILPVINDKPNKLKFIILSSLTLSLIFEVIQLLTSLGEFDIDDLLLNILGAVLGYLSYRVCGRLKGRHN